MSTRPSLDLKFTWELRLRLERFLATTSVSNPTVVLMKGCRMPNPVERWSFGAYGAENIESVEPELARLGETLLFNADGLVVAVPQYHLRNELVGKTLDCGEEGLVVLPRDADI